MLEKIAGEMETSIRSLAERKRRVEKKPQNQRLGLRQTKFNDFFRIKLVIPKLFKKLIRRTDWL